MAPKSKSAVRMMWSFSAAHCINSLSVALFEPTFDQWTASKPVSQEISPSPATNSYPPGLSSRIRKSDLALLRAPRRITQRFKDVVAIQIRIVGQELID